MPKKLSPVWNVPHPRNPFFTGRAQVLGDLRSDLVANGKAALSGLGGIGKTQTATEYAYRYRGEYRAVLWAKADSEDSLKADLAAIAVKLNLPVKEEADRDKVVAGVKRWLEVQAGWLLILDNADDLGLVADLLRREWEGHLLLTTRAHATGSVGSVEIKEMDPEEGALFLLRRAKLIAVDASLGATGGGDDRHLAEEITREVGGLPLALDQAGAFIEEVRSSLGEYLELYRTEGAQLRAARGGLISDHESVTITFSLAFRKVEEASAAAADMLRVCAFLAPTAIPEDIFSDGATELGENLAAVAGGGVNLVKVLGEAGRFSLIRRNAKSGTIDIHRLVQQVLYDEMDEETRQLWAERAVKGLDRVFPVVEHKYWPLCENLLPHAQALVRYIDEYGFEFNQSARLLGEAGRYCKQRALYLEAVPLNARALSIFEKALGPSHPHVATALNNLAYLYNEQGKYEEAEPLYKRALSIFEKAQGPDHLDVALCLSNLASFYTNRERYEEAEPLHFRAISLYEKAYGSDHPELARSFNNLAFFYSKQSKYGEAQPLVKRALGISERALGPDHPNVATSLNNLAFIESEQGRYGEVEQMYKRALGIYERAYGANHPDIALSLSNLATLYYHQGRYAEAEPLYARALIIYENALGPNHPKTALIRKNYINLQQKIADKK